MAEAKPSTSVPEVLKMHREVVERFEAHIEKLRPRRKLTPEELLESQKEEIERTKAALANAKKQREAIVKQWDERIARLQRLADHQAADIDVVERITKGAAKGATKTTTPKPAPTKRGSSRS